MAPVEDNGPEVERTDGVIKPSGSFWDLRRALVDGMANVCEVSGIFVATTSSACELPELSTGLVAGARIGAGPSAVKVTFDSST